MLLQLFDFLAFTTHALAALECEGLLSSAGAQALPHDGKVLAQKVLEDQVHGAGDHSRLLGRLPVQ